MFILWFDYSYYFRNRDLFVWVFARGLFVVLVVCIRQQTIEKQEVMTMTQWALKPGHRKRPLYGGVNSQAGLDLFARQRGGIGRSGSGALRAPVSPLSPFSSDKPGWPHGGGQRGRRVSGVLTLSARGDNQRQATGQPTRWSALHLVHSAESHSTEPSPRALETLWRWRRRCAAAGAAIHGVILIS